MYLKQFRIQNYRSVVDSGIIDVADVTVLIGANESGKSSILRGLSSISMDSSYQYFDLTQLDGILKKFNDMELIPEDIQIVWGKFELSEEEEKELISILKKDVTEISTFEVSKYFDEKYRININDKVYLIPSKYLIEFSQNKIDAGLQELEKKAQTHLTSEKNKPFAQQFTAAIAEAKKLVDVNKKDEATTCLQQLVKFLELGTDQKFKDDVNLFIEQTEQIIESALLDKKLDVSLFEYLLSRMPRTVYFKTYDRLEDDVSTVELKSKPELHRTFLNFLKLAEIKISTVERLDEEKKRQVYIESGCGKATQLLRDAWHQEVLDIELRFSNNRFMVFTKNSKAVETLLPPSLGSEGFQWFLGFYINFGAATNAEYKRAILLIDDPGVFLHPKGHKDLLDLFEEYLKRDVTTIYSTHLPFLIPKKRLKRLRLVEKEASEGRTKVSEKFYAVEDKDILFPLRAALGVALADSLFIGKKTIIAEGLSERILLNCILGEYQKRGIKEIDLDQIEVLAGVGANGAKQYAIMLWVEDLPFVAVLDNDEKGRSAKKEYIKEGIPEEKVVLLPEIVATQKDVDIEDMFPLDIYAEAFHSVHGGFLNLTYEQILAKLKEGNEKVTNKAQALLKKSKYKLDKGEIAYAIQRIISSRERLDDVLIERFNKLFDELDKTIEIYKR